jgi:cysteinyl-tRNA synthetase
MDNDFNTVKAVSEFFGLVRLGNIVSTQQVDTAVLQRIHDLITAFGGVFGLELERDQELTAEEKRLISERDVARQNRDWRRADAIRRQLREKGVILKDYPTGTLWTIERKEKT